MRKLSFLFIMSIFVLSSFACRPANYIVNTSNYSTDETRLIDFDNLSTKQVREAIIDAARSLTWVPKDESPNTIRASIHVRTHRVIVDILYDKTAYTIKYVSSTNMDATPEGKIHPNYNNWVIRLADTIESELSVQSL